MGERELTLDGFQVGPGMLPFRVSLRTGGGRLLGRVESGDPGAVVLMPQDARLRIRPFIVIAPIQGKLFAIDNVRPGDYYVFAFEGSFNMDEMQNPEYALPYLQVAKSARLERGSPANVTLDSVKSIPRR